MNDHRTRTTALQKAIGELIKAARAADEAMWNHVSLEEDKELRTAQENLSVALMNVEAATDKGK